MVDVDIQDIDLDPNKVAQGGLGVLYRGIWRGCEVAVKKPVDPRSGSLRVLDGVEAWLHVLCNSFA